MDLHHHHVARRPWSKEEDKVFEGALVLWPDDTPDRWAMVAAQLQGRTPQEALEHYEALVADVDLIDRGAVQVPACWDDDAEEAAPGRRHTETRRPGKATYQAVPAGAGEVRARGLAQHLALRGADADAHAGGQPRAEVLQQATQPQPPRLQAQEHPRRHHALIKEHLAIWKEERTNP